MNKKLKEYLSISRKGHKNAIPPSIQLVFAVVQVCAKYLNSDSSSQETEMSLNTKEKEKEKCTERMKH